MASSKPVIHGRDHVPGGSDPIPGLGLVGATLIVPESRSSNTVLGTADHAKAIHATATFTQTFTAAATLGSGWWVLLVNASDDGVIELSLLTNAAGETIDGINSHDGGNLPVRMYSGEARLVLCDGSDFSTVLLKGGYVYHDIMYPAAGYVRTIYIPHGATRITFDMIAGGGGGGGGRGDAASTRRKGGGGGGGGGRFSGSFSASDFDLHSFHALAIWAGNGAGGAPGGSSGNGSGGISYLGSESKVYIPGGSGQPILRVFGGMGGMGGNSTANNIPGGPGGGVGGLPETPTDNGNPRGAGNPILPGSTGGAGMGGAGGGSATNTYTEHQYAAEWGGGGGGPVGGGGNSPTAGGASVHGGGGGGGGGGLNSSNAVGAGADGGTTGVYALGFGGAGGSGAAGSDGLDWSGGEGGHIIGEGGGGGGGNGSGTGYEGGGGGFPGGGGGGGGGGTTVGGDGGDGGDGWIKVWFD